jgi:hypothetical protein
MRASRCLSFAEMGHNVRTDNPGPINGRLPQFIQAQAHVEQRPPV